MNDHVNQPEVGSLSDFPMKTPEKMWPPGEEEVPNVDTFQIFCVKKIVEPLNIYIYTMRPEICNCIFPCGLLDWHASHIYLFARLQQL